MKKFLLTMAAAAATLAASAFTLAPVNEAQLGAPTNIKEATPEMVHQLATKTLAARAPKHIQTPVTVASDLLGGYTWTYEMSQKWDVDPSTVETTESGTASVLFYDADDNDGTFMIGGMFDGPISATLDLTSYNYPTFTLGEELAANTTNYGACYIKAVFYYEGDANNNAGWYYTDPLAFVIEDESIWASDVWFFREIATGDYAGYYLTPLWKPGSTMVTNEGVNAVMNYSYNDFDYCAAMSITQDNYVATVTNFAGLADNPVNITLQEDHTWFAKPTLLFSTSNGDFMLYGTDGSNVNVLTGTGTETVLTFDTDWTGYDSETTYWLGQRGAATITLVGDEFVWPGNVEPEAAMYLIGSFNAWDVQTQLPMTLENGKWVITQEMEANAEFKFRNEKEEWIGGASDGNFIVTKEQVEEGTEITLVYGDGGMNFQIPVAGTWTFTIDPETGKLVIAGEWNEPVEETHLYILGNVGDQMWFPNVGTEMEATDDNVFEYTGTFNTNSYFSFTKKLADTDDGWDAIKPYRVGATENDFEVDGLLGETIALGEWSSSSDNAFKIANEGEYTITVDLNDMTVVFTKTEVVIPVEGITLNYTDDDEVVLEAGQTLQLEVYALPEGAIVPEVIWTTSDEEVATVDANGVVTAKELPLKDDAEDAMRRVPADQDGFYFVPVTITATSVDNADVTASVTLYVKGLTTATAINDVNADNGNVTYVNVMGHTSSKPFEGVNIIMRGGQAVGKMVK
ncbi:MAG: SusF/SusE family outer membrane protein [Muribaculaceae bacterium]|nr:SusF/SusE family outer membrane protein [Muribaculaceae bacterium]